MCLESGCVCEWGRDDVCVLRRRQAKYCLCPQGRRDRAPLGHLPNQPQFLQWRPECSSQLWVAVSVKGIKSEGKA